MTPPLRCAGPADVDALLALWALARTEHAVTSDSAGAIRVLLDRSALLVADAPAGGLAGAIVAGWDGWRGNLYRLAVLEAHRRGGLGTALVRAAEAWLIEQGARADQRARRLRGRRRAPVLGERRVRRRRDHRPHGPRPLTCRA